MRLLSFVAICCLFISPIFSQNKYDYTWIFGYGGSDNNPDFGITEMSFKSNEVSLNKREGDMWLYVSNATISDNNGNLLFYTNGCYIADSTHQSMPNSEPLNPGNFHQEQCEYGYPGGSQSCLILPQPNNENLYYLFHSRIVRFDSDIVTDQLLYSLIDIEINGGKGEVIDKNVVVTEDEDLSYGELTAVKHSNGIDWWLINPVNRSNEYLVYLFDSEGIHEPIRQAIGNSSPEAGQGSGQICFSPDGRKFARYNTVSGLFLFDFDRSTGLLDNFQEIFISDALGTGGLSFSPNSQFLYTSTNLKLYQADTEQEDIESSVELIGEYDGFASPTFSTNFYQQQLGPDCRIYMNSNNSVDYLHVIQHPDRKGMACDFQQHAVKLPTLHQASLPHFPNYRLGQEASYPCDSTIVLNTVTVSNTVAPQQDQTLVNCYPNPVKDVLTIELSAAIKNGQLELFSLLGQQVYQRQIQGEQLFQIQVGHLPAGIYFIKIIDNQQQLVTEQKVIITK